MAPSGKPHPTAEVKDIVFTPNDAVATALAAIEKRRSYTGAGVDIGIPGVDGYLLPGRPGELITVLGMTSNYKSGVMQWWARHTAGVIADEQIEDECVIYVTWEQAIEEMVAFDLAATARISATRILQGKVTDAEMERLRVEIGPRRVVTPLYLIGHSIAEGKRRPRLTLDAVGHGVNLIRKEWGLRPRAIFLDYLQQIDSTEGEDRRMQVFHNVLRCKDMGLALGCPVIMGCQAKRTVYREQWGVPGLADGLESSNIEHTSDKALGVWLPKTTHGAGTRLKTDGNDEWLELTVNDQLLVVQVLKQRLGPAGKWFPLHVDLATNEIAPLTR